MNKKILDDAFKLVRASYNDTSREKARDQLLEIYSSKAQENILEAFSKACDLADSCYHFGDKCRDKIISEDEALTQMEKEFPGFSKATYKNALGYGYFISR